MRVRIHNRERLFIKSYKTHCSYLFFWLKISGREKLESKFSLQVELDNTTEWHDSTNPNYLLQGIFPPFLDSLLALCTGVLLISDWPAMHSLSVHHTIKNCSISLRFSFLITSRVLLYRSIIWFSIWQK